MSSTVRSFDVAVIGGGPAGLSAALAAARAGGAVVLFDEGIALGGRMHAAATERDARPELVADLEAQTSVDVVRAKVWGLTPGWSIHSTAPSHRRVEVAAVVVATGSVEVGLPLSGWTLPGVHTAWGALRLLTLGGVRPSSTFAVIGEDRWADGVAARLESGGAIVLPLAKADEKVARVRDVMALRGTSRVTSVQMRSGNEVAVDSVCLSNGQVPLLELATAATDGAPSAVEGLFIAGDASRVASIAEAVESGATKGRDAARYASDESVPVEALYASEPAIPSGVLPDADEIVCRCEDVSYARLSEMVDRRLTPNQTKHLTRFAMGLCGGRACIPLAHSVAGLSGRFTARVPARPLSVTEIANSPVPQRNQEG